MQIPYSVYLLRYMQIFAGHTPPIPLRGVAIGNGLTRPREMTLSVRPRAMTGPAPLYMLLAPKANVVCRGW